MERVEVLLIALVQPLTEHILKERWDCLHYKQDFGKTIFSNTSFWKYAKFHHLPLILLCQIVVQDTVSTKQFSLGEMRPGRGLSHCMQMQSTMVTEADVKCSKRLSREHRGQGHLLEAIHGLLGRIKDTSQNSDTAPLAAIQQCLHVLMIGF